jgi:hypothetical protein
MNDYKTSALAWSAGQTNTTSAFQIKTDGELDSKLQEILKKVKAATKHKNKTQHKC